MRVEDGRGPGTHSPAFLLGALPHMISALLLRLLNSSARNRGAASGVEITNAGRIHVAKRSKEQRLADGDIFQSMKDFMHQSFWMIDSEDWFGGRRVRASDDFV